MENTNEFCRLTFPEELSGDIFGGTLALSEEAKNGVQNTLQEVEPSEFPRIFDSERCAKISPS